MNHAMLLKGATIAALTALLLGGCATQPAAEFGGRWKPVNRFSKTTSEIPLYTSYVYQASPMDGTLKTMLERWARDSGMTLDYRISSDYTLYRGVAEISNTSPQAALVELTAAYAGQGISVSIIGNRIVVDRAVAAESPSVEAESASDS
jgi:hypothetical protein